MVKLLVNGHGKVCAAPNGIEFVLGGGEILFQIGKYLNTMPID